MAQTNYDSGNNTGNFNVTVPSNAFNIYVTVAGGAGAGGGGDSGGDGGGGGSGRYGRFQLTNYVSRALQCRPGGSGGGGGSCFGSGGSGGGSNTAGGGGGGNASGCSGSGGGGGGASGVFQTGLGWIICAGGGGGGGGGSWNRGGSGGSGAGGWSGGGTFGTSGGSGGSNASCGDGAGGGGGGGGAGGGGGGAGGCDFQSGGGGGGGGGSRYASNNGVSLLNDSTNGGGGYVRVQYTAVTPEITFSSTQSLNQQYSVDGIPRYDITFNFTAVDVTSLTLTSSAGESWNVLNTTSKEITNLPQSVAGSNSPVTRTYTLTGCFQSVCTSKEITVSVKNDYVFSNGWTTTFSNLEPNVTNYTVSLGTLSGIDMPIIVSSTNSGVFFSNSSTGSFSNPKTFTNGQTVYARTTTLPFNTDVTGETGIYGKVNTKTIPITIGPSSYNLQFITKKPVIRETFDYDGNPGVYPYTDIDLIDNVPTEFVLTQTIQMDDIQIAMPIQSNNPDLQIKINNGTWKNVGEIT